MTPDEAIRTITDIENYHRDEFIRQELTALKLGIEALKRCKVLAENSPLWAAKPLPGETEE